MAKIILKDFFVDFFLIEREKCKDIFLLLKYLKTIFIFFI